MFVGFRSLLAERELRIVEQVEKRFLLVPTMGFQRLDNAFRRKSFVNEQRQRRHFQVRPFGLPSPVQERRRHGLELCGRGLRRFEVFRFQNVRDERFGLLPFRVPFVPFHRRGQRTIEAILCRSVIRFDERMRPRIRHTRAFCRGMRVMIDRRFRLLCRFLLPVPDHRMTAFSDRVYLSRSGKVNRQAVHRPTYFDSRQRSLIRESRIVRALAVRWNNAA